uniref:Isopropylmalate dehydrogenase-like domain-containing protein n=4 Tax=Cannabis sativa TaxID=3483 RepID=A0A803PAG2_CANSA
MESIRPKAPSMRCVADLMYRRTRSWNLGYLCFLFGTDMGDRISKIQIVMNVDCDTLIWKDSLVGKFNVKGAYWVDQKARFGNSNVLWRWIWDSEVHPRLSLMIWRVCSNSLSTGDKFLSLEENSCLVCHSAPETSFHLLARKEISSKFFKLCKDVDGDTLMNSVQLSTTNPPRLSTDKCILVDRSFQDGRLPFICAKAINFGSTLNFAYNTSCSARVNNASMASHLLRRVLGTRSNQIISSTSPASPLTAAARLLSSATAPITVTLFPGDGIGPEIAESVKQVFREAEVPIVWEEHYVGTEIDPKTQSFLTWESLESVRRNKVGLKGPMATPIGKGHRSLNLTLRKELNLFANVRPCYSLPGYKTRYDDVDLITIRENTEGEYSGLEHQVVRGVVESLKIITRQASLRVAEYAFHYAKAHGRERVSAIHKANIMQKTDGLFLKCCREVAEKYPEIRYEEVVIDNCCMMLVKNPALFDVLVMPNLYGDIISDLCAGLIGGLGLTPSCNIGEGGIALAEAVHGSAPDIAGKNLANPTALLLSSVSMLRHLELHDKADRIQDAILNTIAEGKFRTADLGGNSSTTDFTKAICNHL